jgi:drug/metabolite transporter (DMT)-like permease
VRPAPSAAWGIALVIAAVACFATLDTTTKLISIGGVPLLMALWFRYFFQAMATTLVVLPTRGWRSLRTAHPKFQLLRGLLLLTSSLFAFLSLKHMPVAEFTSIVAVVPLAITLLAARTLRETVSRLRWSLIIGGFLGTLIIIRPGSEHFGWPTLFPLVVVVSITWFQVLTSQLARTEDPVTMHFYTGWVGTLVASLALPFVWASLPSWWLWAGLVLMGLTASVGHLLLILAYTRTTAATLTPFFYAQIGFAMLGGWLIFSHVPDGWSLIGIGMIALCGALGAWLTARESHALKLVKPQPVES